MVAESGGGASGRADAAWPTAAITASAARTLRRFLCTSLLVQLRPYAPCAGSVNAVESPPLRRLPTTKKAPWREGAFDLPSGHPEGHSGGGIRTRDLRVM